jgi:ribonuclease J
VAVIENGMVVEFTCDGDMLQEERIPGGYVFVDGSSVGEVGPAVMREREILAQDGFILVNLTLDRTSCKLREEPEIITRGFVYEPDAEDLLDNTRRIVTESINCVSNGRLQGDLEQAVKSYLYTKTKRRPMVFVTLSQV